MARDVARDVDEGGAVSGQKPAIRGIDHVQITVPRGEEAAAAASFTAACSGSPKSKSLTCSKLRGGFWLAVGDRELHVGTEDGVNRRATKRTSPSPSTTSPSGKAQLTNARLCARSRRADPRLRPLRVSRPVREPPGSHPVRGRREARGESTKHE